MAEINWAPEVLHLATAIKVAEGSNPAWNNPGDLTGADACSFKTLGTANAEGVLIFANADDGWNALCMKIFRMFAGKSKVYKPTDDLAVVGMKYSGKDPNWAKNVAAYLGVPETTTLAELAPKPAQC